MKPALSPNNNQIVVDAANDAVLDYELTSASFKQTAYQTKRQVAQTGNELCNLLAVYYQNQIAAMGAITAYAERHGPDALSSQLAQDPLSFGPINGAPPDPNHIARLVVAYNHAQQRHKQAAKALSQFLYQDEQDQEEQQ